MNNLREFLSRATRMVDITTKAAPKFSEVENEHLTSLSERFEMCKHQIDTGIATGKTKDELIDVVTGCQSLLEKKTKVKKESKQTFASYGGGYHNTSYYSNNYNNNGFGLMDWLILDAILDNHETVVNNYVDPSYIDQSYTDQTQFDPQNDSQNLITNTDPVINDPFATNQQPDIVQDTTPQNSYYEAPTPQNSFDEPSNSGIGGTQY